MKIIVTIIPSDLVTKFVFILFLPFLANKKQESGLQQVHGLVTRNISVFLFIASRGLLQSHAEFNRLL